MIPEDVDLIQTPTPRNSDVDPGHLSENLGLSKYRKVPKFSDTRKLCCNSPKIQTKRHNLKVFCQKYANRIANSEDPNLGAV